MNTRSDKQIDKEVQQTTARYQSLVNSRNEVFEALREWHTKQMDRLNLITEHKDADLDFGEGMVVKAGTEMAKGFHIGVMIASSFISKFPSLEIVDDKEDCGDE